MQRTWKAVVATAMGLTLCGVARAGDGLDDLRRTVEEQQRQLAEQARRIAELESGQMKQESALDEAVRSLTVGVSGDATLSLRTTSAKRSKMDFYGFVRLDAAYSDSQFQDNQIVGWVLSEDPSAPAGVGAKKDSSDLTIYARLTRIGVKLDGGRLASIGEPDIKGNIEVDFYGGGSDSRNLFRMRRAFLQLDWGHTQFLAGQTQDLMAPLYPAVNADLVMWGAGNLGDRRPQVRLTHQLDDDKTWEFAAMAGLSGAIDGDDLDGDRVPDGESSSRPTLQARLGHKGHLDDDHPFELGVWGYRACEDPRTSVGGANEFDADAIGVDLQCTLVPDLLSFKGEWWTGENLDDVRGGILQGVNTTTGKEIGATGGFGEVWWKVSPELSFVAGYSRDDPDNGDLNAGDRSKNVIRYVAARWNSGPLGFGAEFLRWKTEYSGLGDGDADRVVLYVSYTF